MVKIFISFLVYIIIIPSLYAQSGQWTWLSGDTAFLSNSTGVYGIKGVPSPLNIPPGRYEACEWYRPQDSTFWFYGGTGCDAEDCTNDKGTSDLWQYSLSTKMWTWMNGDSTESKGRDSLEIFGPKGVFTDSASPGRRKFAYMSWTDNNGDLWLFGGQIYNALRGTVLWKYDVNLNQWAWMNGNTSNNQGFYGTKGIPCDTCYPPARDEAAAAFVDNSNNLWLFGGSGRNDLWKYEILSNQWTWVSGDSLVGTAAVYGIKGISSISNKPGGTNVHGHWIINDDIWVFCGQNGGGRNELWRYSISSGEWTWESGDSVYTLQGCYYQKGIYSDCNLLKGRFENRASWVDSDGDLWLFGGSSSTATQIFSDLWMYSVSRSQWVWVGGSEDATPTSFVKNGVYGSLGIAAPTNWPQSSTGSNAFVDFDRNFYLWGGLGTGILFSNLLWKYELPDKNLFQDAPTPIANFSADITQSCVPFNVNFTNLTDSVFKMCDNTFQYFWDFGDGSTDTMINPSHTYVSPGTYTVKLKVISLCNGSDSTIFVDYITADTFPIADLMPDSIDGCVPFTYSPANNSTVTNYTYNWDFGDGNNDTIALPIHSYSLSGDYILQLIVSNSCGVDSDEIAIKIYPNPVVVLGNDTDCISGNFDIIANGGDFISYNWNTGDTTKQININNSGIYTVLIIDSNRCTDSGIVVINFAVKPIAILLDSIEICKDNQIQLIASGGTNYRWSPDSFISSLSIFNPVVEPNKTIRYTVIISDSCGLSDTESVNVIVNNCDIFIPNSFSPNRDGANELFRIRGEGIESIMLKIYDRWGNNVFETTNLLEGWNGKSTKGSEMASGVYVYYLTASFVDGAEIVQKGNVTLLR